MKDFGTQFHRNNLTVNTEGTRGVSFHTTQNRLPSSPQATLKNMDIAYKT